jgi:hypothetical protein
MEVNNKPKALGPGKVTELENKAKAEAFLPSFATPRGRGGGQHPVV